MDHDALVTLLSARVESLEQIVSVQAARLELFRKLAEENRQHLYLVGRAEQIMRRAGSDTGPMPAVVPQPRAHKRPNPGGLHIVRGYGAAALAWLFKGTFGVVKAHKLGTAAGLGLAALLIAGMPTVRLSAHALDIDHAPAVHLPSAAPQPVIPRRHLHLHRHHRPDPDPPGSAH